MLLLEDIPIDQFWSSPIPDQKGRRATRGYTEIPIDTSHPRYREPLVNLADHGIACYSTYYGSRRNAAAPGNYPYHKRLPHSLPHVWVRESVAEAFVRANGYLRKRGMRLVALDGYRRPELQSYLRDEFWPNRFREEEPGISDVDIEGRLQSFLSTPRTDPLKPSPHLTGGAVDVAIWRMSEGWLDMGTRAEDPGRLSHVDAFEPHRWEGPGINLEVVHNRRLLFWIMYLAGFHVHTDEWWHYMRGDQMWAQQEGFEGTAVSAYYSVAEEPPEMAASCA